MRKQMKIGFALAASIMICGLIVFGGAMTAMRWNFSKLSTVKLETNTHTISEAFENVAILSNVADICIVPSEDSGCRVVCSEDTKQKHTVTVENSTLSIQLVNQRKWYDYIGLFNFSTPQITVYIPAGEYGDLTVNSGTGELNIAGDFTFENMEIRQSTGNVTNYASADKGIQIKTSTGKVFLENLSAESLDITVSTGSITVKNVVCRENARLSVSTGKTYLTDLKCNNLDSSGTTGNIQMQNVIAEGTITIDRSTGKVEFDACDASEIFVKTDTGDVTGSLLSEKVFIAQTDTGRIAVPESTAGGKCKITTDTGDIKIVIEP